jgi:hypothetical protein
MSPSRDSYTRYQDAKFYDRLVVPPSPEFIDMRNEKTLYGKVNKIQDAVYIPPHQAELRIKETLHGTQSTQALNFVIDSFNALQTHILKATAARRVDNLSRFADLHAVQGWSDPNDLYDFYAIKYFDAFNKYLLGSRLSPKVISVEDYVNQLLDYIRFFANIAPLSLSSFIKSAWCSPKTSGLILDTAKANFDGTYQQKQLFLRDPAFLFYKNAAVKHGFYVDRYAPWRLVANVSSIPMQQWMVPLNTFVNTTTGEFVGAKDYDLIYDPGTSTNLFSEYFTPAYLNDIALVRHHIVEGFNRLAKFENYVKVPLSTYRTKEVKLTNLVATSKDYDPHFSYYTKRTALSAPESCSGAFALLKRKLVTQENFDLQYTDMYMLKFIMDSKILEHNLQISPSDYDEMVKNIVMFNKFYGFSKTQVYVKEKIKHYVGNIVNPATCQSFMKCETEDPKETLTKAFNSVITSIPGQPTTY